MLRSLAALTAALVLAGCTAAPTAPSTSVTPTDVGSSATPPPSQSATVTPAPTPSVELKTIEISLKGGKVSPNGERVTLAKGTILRLVITADHEDKVHVHGYDVEIAVKSGASVTKDITLDQVGRFEIESHEPALTILQLVVS